MNAPERESNLLTAEARELLAIVGDSSRSTQERAVADAMYEFCILQRDRARAREQEEHRAETAANS
jgi:hypothetical protein